jgi:type VI protein secretion system component Hcp
MSSTNTIAPRNPIFARRAWLRLGLLAIAVTMAPAAARATTTSGSGADNGRVVGTLSIGPGTLGAMDIRGYSWSIINTAGSGSGTTGKSVVSELVVTKLVDGNSPQLMLSSAQGQSFDTAVITIFKEGTRTPLVRYKLEHLVISSHSSSDKGRANGFPIEEVGLRFSTLRVTFGSTTTAFDFFGQRSL